VDDVIGVRGLVVARGPVILKGIDWRVRPGEHWAVLGANGSGKTSLLNALSGYMMPTDGVVTVLGETYGENDWRDLRKRLGLVTASLAARVEPDENVLETVASGKDALINFWGKLSAADRRAAREILKRVECLPLEKRAWGTLSQGERQRVLIGRALRARPALLLLDEPCAGLDPAARETFVSFLGKLARRPSPTLVLVTHHVEEIPPAFSHALLLKNGRVLAAGPKEKTLTSAVLSRAFGAPVRLTAAAGRYRLDVTPRRSVVL
jgi:iron complex transport system ATP-binding protein